MSAQPLRIRVLDFVFLKLFNPVAWIGLDNRPTKEPSEEAVNFVKAHNEEWAEKAAQEGLTQHFGSAGYCALRKGKLYAFDGDGTIVAVEEAAPWLDAHEKASNAMPAFFRWAFAR